MSNLNCIATKPLKHMLDVGLLDGFTTILDYGCADVQYLNSIGFKASGYNKYSKHCKNRYDALISTYVLEDNKKIIEIANHMKTLSDNIYIAVKRGFNCINLNYEVFEINKDFMIISLRS